MAAQWGSNSLAPGQSAGWFFARANLTGALPVLQVMPLTPSSTNALWFLSSGGYPFLNQLGISTMWSQLSNDLNSLVYYLVVQNNSDNVVEYAFLEADLPSPEPAAPIPASGLGSNSNYFMCNCDFILGLSVIINVTQDIVGTDGFGFQVNCYSASGDVDGAQQYVFSMDPSGNLWAWVNNWQNPSTALVNTRTRLGTFSGAELPAGYSLTVALLNDANGNITGAVYSVTDNAGNPAGNATIDLIPLVQAADLAPIVAFQLDFVDWANGGNTTLSSGAGEITYTATSSLTVENTEPGCVDWGYGTLETANSIYSPVPAGTGQEFTQAFATGSAAAVIRRSAPVRHKLTPP
jgi:hypothetical protein